MTEFAASRALYRGFLFLITLVIGALLFRELIWVLVDLFAALIIAAAMTPIVNALTKSERALRWRWRPPRALVVLVTYVLAGIVLILLGSLVLATLASEAAKLIQNLPEYAAAFATWLNGLAATYPMVRTEVTTWVSANIQVFVKGIVDLMGHTLEIVGLALGALGSFLSILFVLFLALYLTVDGPRFREYLVVFFPITQQPRMDRLIRDVVSRLGHWAVGQGLLCVIVGGGAWIGLQLIGVPYAPLLGVVWALAEFIPGIGPFISAIPSILFGFLVSPVVGLLSAIFCLAWSQVENNVITPKVMGDAVDLHPLVILSSLLIGSELLGFPGALLAIPAAATIAVVVDELHRERLRQQVITQADVEAAEGLAAAESKLIVSGG